MLDNQKDNETIDFFRKKQIEMKNPSFIALGLVALAEAFTVKKLWLLEVLPHL